jgi:hypothetical protein
MASKSPMAAAAAVACSLAVAGCTAGSWQSAGASVDECVRRAKLAIRDSDFTERLAVFPREGEMIVYGQHGGYRAHLHCVPDQPLRVEVTGFDPVVTERYKESIIKRF